MSTVPPDGPTEPTPDPAGPAVPPPAQPVYGAPTTPPPYAGAAAPPPYGTPGTPPPYGQPGTPPPYAAAPPPAYGQPGYGYAPQPLSPSDERLWAVLAHIGGIVLGFIAPLVIWLVFRERSRFVEDQGKEALNFQITAIVAAVVLGLVTFWGAGFGAFLVGIAVLVFMILGAVAANRGEAYRYPINWRVVK